MKPKRDSIILDVGVSNPSSNNPFVNFLEKVYPHQENLVIVSIQDVTTINKVFPKAKVIKADGKRLPFRNDCFDIGFSNAVVEHIECKRGQIQFIEEILRVSKKSFITTPNFYFPIEPHSMIPFVHFFPFRFRSFIFKKMRKPWCIDVNLLNPKGFKELFPRGYSVKIILPIPYNVIVGIATRF